MAHMERTSAAIFLSLREQAKGSGTLSADSGLAKTHAHEGMTRRPAPSDQNERIRAIGLMILATICFALLDTTAKYLVGAKHLPVGEVTWLRFVGHVLFSLAVLWPSFAFRPSLR